MDDPFAMIAPSVARTTAIDQSIRDRLAMSLDYLAGFLAAPDWDRTADLANGITRLKAGPVPPWVFGFYAILVQAASKGDHGAARADFDRMLAAIHAPFDPMFLPVGDPSLSEAHWNVARLLFDTDAKRRFRPIAPTSEQTALVTAEVGTALALLEKCAPDFAAEMAILHRLILLGVPSRPDDPGQFNAASTFFLWQVSILNAQTRRSIVAMIDVLVHEASHLLLFGLVAGNALSQNDPAARYTSPLRKDPRPIDGIFHAVFVTTRVHLALMTMRETADLSLRSDIDSHAGRNGTAALTGLDLLKRELLPTPAGQEILDALVAYWQDKAPAKP